jgi:hypothetical protein
MLRLLQLIETSEKQSGDMKINFNFTNVQPFVFSVRDDDKLKLEIPISDGKAILSTPFKVWSYEMSDGYGIINPHKPENGAILCTVVKEIFPGKYEFLVMYAGNEGFIVIPCNEKTKILGDLHEQFYIHCMDHTNMMLERLHDERSGILKTRMREKFKYNGEKLIYKQNIVICISPKINENLSKNISPNPINWTHVWSVRGHWRKLENQESIGKDRLGCRTIKGYTWIDSFLKGEGQELIKIRKL